MSPLPFLTATASGSTSYARVPAASPTSSLSPPSSEWDDERTSSLWTVLAGIILAWYLIINCIAFLGFSVARVRYGQAKKTSGVASSRLRDGETPGVSILRPLKGLDPNLYENLKSAFTQDYPDYEIIFSVADANDPALGVVRLLQDKYAGRRECRVVIGDEQLGPNPKVNNLVRPFERATHDILWVLDSGILLPSRYTLAHMVDSLLTPHRTGTRVGLVHQVPFALLPGKGGQGVGGWLERAFLNTNHAKMYLAINKTEIDSCVMGKSNMYRRSDVSQLVAGGTTAPPSSNVSLPTTGLASFAPYLAEDNMIGLGIFHQLKLRHAMTSDVALNAVGSMTFSDYFWRRVRWIRVRKQMTRAATLVEPFTESLVMGLLSAWAAQTLFGFSTLLFLSLHWLLWSGMDIGTMVALAPEPMRTDEWPLFACAYIGREVLALPIWLVAMTGNEVTWRGTRYVVLPNGKAREVEGGGGNGGWKSWLRGLRGMGEEGVLSSRYQAVDTDEQ